MTRRFTPLARRPIARRALPAHAERALHDRPRPHPQARPPGAAGGAPGRRARGGEHDPRLLLPRPHGARREALLRGDGEARGALLGPDPVAERGGRGDRRCARASRGRDRSASSATASTCGASTPRGSRPGARRRTRALARASRRTRRSWASWGGWSPRRACPSCSRRPASSASAIRASRFLIVGAADEEKADQISAAAAGRRDDAGVCVFAGFRHDMPELYRSMDVFVLPSHREGFPRAPMEASAMKVPCVVTDVRGCRQAVTHGRNGLAGSGRRRPCARRGDPRRAGRPRPRPAAGRRGPAAGARGVRRAARLRRPSSPSTSACSRRRGCARACRSRSRAGAWTSRARSRGDEHATPQDSPFAAAPRARRSCGSSRRPSPPTGSRRSGRTWTRSSASSPRRWERAHAAALSSGTAALHLALRSLGVGPGDEVLCSTLTFVASANPIVYQGAAPVFVDCEPRTLEHGPRPAGRGAASRAARRGRLPRAVVLVHLYGQSADLDPILAACERHGVPVVEDAAEALGATYRGTQPRHARDASASSPSTATRSSPPPGGGMLVSADEERDREARASWPRRRATPRRTTSTRRPGSTTG